jgi:hypothetical protein
MTGLHEEPYCSGFWILRVAHDQAYSNELEVRKLAAGSTTKYINPFGDHRTLRKVILPREFLL